MGSQNSMAMIQHRLPNDYKSSTFNPNIYVSLIDSTKLEKHVICINSKQDFQYEQQMFIFRKCHSDHIIAARYFQNMSMVNYCAKSYEVCFYTEQPEYLLNEVQNFTYQDGYYYLIDALKGFTILSQKVGWFRVNSKMVVFDRDCRTKVWLSDEYSQTKVRNQRKLRTQREFIMNIVNIFDNRVSNPSNENNYWKMIEKNYKMKKIQSLTIEQALNIVIRIAEQLIPVGQNRSLKLSSSASQIFNMDKNSISEPQVSTAIAQNAKFNASNKQKSLKRSRKPSQQFVDPNNIQIKQTNQFKNRENNKIKNYTENQTTNSNCRGEPQKVNNKIPNNDFSFNMNTNMNNTQTSQQGFRINISNGQTTRNQIRNYPSHQKGVIIDKKKVRKSMDQYEIQNFIPSKVQDTKNVIKQQKNSNFLAVPCAFQKQKRQSEGAKKRISYEICQTNNFIKQPSQFKGYNLQQQKQQELHAPTKSFLNQANVNVKINTSQSFNRDSHLTKFKDKDNETAENMFPCSINPGKSFNNTDTLKSIIYSEMPNEESNVKSNHFSQKKQIQQKIANIPSFNRYKR